MPSSNSYYRIERSLGLLAPIGISVSNTWLGASRAVTTCHQPRLFHRGDELHSLVGGTFAVTASGEAHRISPGTPPHLFDRDTGAQGWMPSMVEGLVDHGYLRTIDVGTKPADGYRRDLPVLADGLPHRVYPPGLTLRTIAEDILVEALELALLPEDEVLPNLAVACRPPGEDHVAVARGTLRDGDGTITHQLLFSLSRDLLSARLADVRGADDRTIPEFADRARAMSPMPTLPDRISGSPEVDALRSLVAELGGYPLPSARP